MGYVSVLLAGDEQKRSLTIACMNAFGSAVATIYGYDTNKAPRFPRGISLSLAFVAFELRQHANRFADEEADKVQSGSTDTEEEEKADALTESAAEVAPAVSK